MEENDARCQRAQKIFLVNDEAADKCTDTNLKQSMEVLNHLLQKQLRLWRDSTTLTGILSHMKVSNF